MQELTSLLENKFNQQKLGHFYILTIGGISSAPQELITEWSNKLLDKFTKAKGSTVNKLNSPDILQIGLSDTIRAKKTYLVEDFQELFKFQETAPIELGHKFVIIHDAHKLTDVSSNKLLKILEEPNKNMTIFLLNPFATHLLPTILSRAIKLRIPANEQVDNETLSTAQNLKKQFSEEQITTTQFIDFYKSGKISESSLMKAMMHLSLESSFQSQQELLEIMKWFETSKTFHNSLQERLFESYHWLKNNFEKQA
jgi:hypothetical protein